MKRIIEYKAKDPYYSDQTQVFIGMSEEELNQQVYEFEQWLGKEHECRLMTIYERREIK